MCAYFVTKRKKKGRKEGSSLVHGPSFSNNCRSKIKKHRSYRIQSTGGRSSIDSSVAGSETMCIRDESIEREKKETSPIQASSGHSSSSSSQSKAEESISASAVSDRAKLTL